MLTAAKEGTFSASSDPCVFFPLAASEGVPENSRLGFARKNPAPHQGSAWPNSGKALGIEEVVWENCGGSDDSARYYDQNVGRFISEDPVGYAGGDDFYSFVDNDPIDFADPSGLCPTPTSKKPCDATLPSNPRRRTMVQTAMGEMSGQDMAGQNQFADDESGPVSSIGDPGGSEITSGTLDAEALLLAQTMLNLGHIGNARTYRGLPAGRRKTAQAVKSTPGSPLCIMLKRAISAVNTASDSPDRPATTGWRSVVQGPRGHHFVRDLGNASRVAGTDFLY
jgi:RHS repeat-associated protein